MQAKVAILWLYLFFGSQTSPAATAFYQFDACRDIWVKQRSGLHGNLFTILKSDFKREDLAEDQTHEVEAASLKVYQTYRQVLKKKRLSDAFIDDFMGRLEEEDRASDKSKVHYFVYRNPLSTEVEGVVRVMILLDGASDSSFLSRLSKTNFENVHLQRNKVVFSRLVALASKTGTPITKELTYSVAHFLSHRLGTMDFHIYADTGASRARLYQRDYNFSLVGTPDQTGLEDCYVVGIPGRDFLYIYKEHVEQAYTLGIGKKDVAAALSILQDATNRFKLHDFGPTRNAIKHMQMMHAVFFQGGLPRGRLVDQLAQGDKSESNLDFEIYFLARANYDLLKFRGRGEAAISILLNHIEYLKAQPDVPPRRIARLEEHVAIFKAHQGNAYQLAAMRARDSNVSPETDVAGYSQFIAELARLRGNFAGSDRLFLESQEFFHLKERYLDPAFNSFAKITNPLVLAEFSRLYSAAGHTRESAILTGMAHPDVD